MPTYKYSDFSYGPYKNAYEQLIQAATDKLANFKYNPEEDQSYQTYRDYYTNAGQTAQEDSLAKLASRTGGIANSYAVSAAQQQYNNYMQALNNKIPELEQMARDVIQNELNNYRSLEADDYNKYVDDRAAAMSAWSANADNAYRSYQTEADRYNNELNYYLDRAQAQDQAEAAELAYQRQLALQDLQYARQNETSATDWQRQLEDAELAYQRQLQQGDIDWSRQLQQGDIDWERQLKLGDIDWDRQQQSAAAAYERQVALSNLSHSQSVALQNMKNAAAMQQLQAEQNYKLQLAQMEAEQAALERQAAEKANSARNVKSLDSLLNQSNGDYLEMLERASMNGYSNGNLYSTAQDLWNAGALTDEEWEAMQQKYRVGNTW